MSHMDSPHNGKKLTDSLVIETASTLENPLRPATTRHERTHPSRPVVVGKRAQARFAVAAELALQPPG